MSRIAVPSISSNIGMNYYHESMGYYSRTNQQIDDDLDKISALNKRIKVYHSPYQNAGGVSALASLAICKNIVERAKAKGFYVVWCENHEDGGNHLNGNPSGVYSWSDYSSLVQADASEAKGSGADEFLVGNEISIHNDDSSTYNDINLPVNIKNLATACKVNFSGLVGYEDGWWKKDSWNNAGLGSLDKIYFTLYEAQAKFKDVAQDIFNKFGNNSSIGEFSTQSGFDNSAKSEQDWFVQLANRLQILINIGFTNIWYFCFREGIGDFGVLEQGDEINYHLAWQALFRGRQWYYV